MSIYPEPNKNELYWFTEDGFVFYKRYHYNQVDFARYANGNCFRTRKKALKHYAQIEKYNKEYHKIKK